MHIDAVSQDPKTLHTDRSFCTQTVWQGPIGPYKSTCFPLTASAQGILRRLELPILTEFAGCQQQPSMHLFLLCLCHWHCTFIPGNILVTRLKCIKISNAGTLTVWSSCTERLNWEEDFWWAAKLVSSLFLREVLCWDGSARAAPCTSVSWGSAPGRERTVIFFVLVEHHQPVIFKQRCWLLC